MMPSVRCQADSSLRNHERGHALNSAPDGSPGPRIARAGQPAGLPPALRELGIRTGRPVLVAVGGAGGMTPDATGPLAKPAEHVVRALDRWDGVVVDGGTDSGIMKVMGDARHATGAGLPLVGVAAEGTVIVPGRPARAGAAPLEPGHTHVILVPGSEWGDESPWLSRVATAIAGGRPSVTLVVNGGQITYRDIDHSLAAGRPVIVLAGTGRAADAIAAATGTATGTGTGTGGQNPRASRIAASPGTRVIQLRDTQGIYAAIESILAPAASA